MADSSGVLVINALIAASSGTDYSGPVLELPRLTLVPDLPGQLQLSWSANRPTFTLESCPTLAGECREVTAGIETSGDRRTLTVDASAGSQMFRLRQN